MKLRIGTRGSKLALTQARWIESRLKEIDSESEIELVIIKTKGDIIQNKTLDKIGDRGLFVKEIQKALLEKRIDLAVHSMKDMPSKLQDGLMFAKAPMREKANDVLITPHKINSIDELPKNSKIGTGSKRRMYQLLQRREDIVIEPIRGNVDTRIKKMLDNKLDGIILAQAGINRLGIKSCEEYKIIEIPVDIMIPAPAQGILGLEIKEDRKEIYDLLDKIKDEKSDIQCVVERAFLEGVNGSCHTPVGAYCEVIGEKVILVGLLGKEDGTNLICKKVTGDTAKGKEMAYNLAKTISNEVHNVER